jgi:isoamylase
VDFVGCLTGLRRQYAQLRPRRWLNGELSDGSRDVVWLTPDATEKTIRDWHYPEGRFLSYLLAPVEDSPGPLFIVLNGAAEAIPFVLPEWPGVVHWRPEIETGQQERSQSTFEPGDESSAPARSVTVFAGSA